MLVRGNYVFNEIRVSIKAELVDIMLVQKLFEQNSTSGQNKPLLACKLESETIMWIYT